jgi:Lon protease-like protein
VNDSCCACARERTERAVPTDQFELPMFPLGTVLFPHGVLPIHVFEPRYRALVDHCLAGDARFGVVLIERGSEVGGGDSRFDVGTIAQIVQAGRLADGRWALATVGTERVRIVEWLADDPYPRAIVEPCGDDDMEARDGDSPSIEAVRELLQRVHALRAQLGLPAHAGDVVVSPDVVRASFEAAILAPLGPLDCQELLELDDAVERLDRLTELLTQEIELLEFRLSE